MEAYFYWGDADRSIDLLGDGSKSMGGCIPPSPGFAPMSLAHIVLRRVPIPNRYIAGHFRATFKFDGTLSENVLKRLLR